jgi:hypothetical protein
MRSNLSQKKSYPTYAKVFIESMKTPSTHLPLWKEIFFELITKRHYTASQIANRAGISKTIIHKLLKGITYNLSFKNFRKLLRLYFAVCYDMHGMKIEYPEKGKE